VLFGSDVGEGQSRRLVARTGSEQHWVRRG
jgi:hypothetical protein